MAQPVEQSARHHSAKRRAVDFRSKMSDHIAYALLVYTGLQIFVTMAALKGDGASILPYFALVVLVALIIPACRAFEKRWNMLSDEEAADISLKGRFLRDVSILWALAIGLPFLLTAVFKSLAIAL